jgi:hypothetical protein
MIQFGFRAALVAAAVGTFFAMSGVYAYRLLEEGSQVSAGNGRMVRVAGPETWWEGFGAGGPSIRCKGCHARN